MVEDMLRRKVRKYIEDIILWYIDGDRNRKKIRKNIVGDWKLKNWTADLVADTWLVRIIKVRKKSEKEKIIKELNKIQKDIEKGKLIRSGIAWMLWKERPNGDIRITIATDDLFLFEVKKRDNKKVINKVWKAIEKNMEADIRETIKKIEEKWPEIIRKPEKKANNMIAEIIFKNLWNKVTIKWDEDKNVYFHILGSNGASVIGVKHEEVKMRYCKRFIKFLEKLDKRIVFPPDNKASGSKLNSSS